MYNAILFLIESNLENTICHNAMVRIVIVIVTTIIIVSHMIITPPAILA